MNTESAQSWNTMVQDPDSEFSNFLDFNDINIDFPAFDTEQPQDGLSQQDNSNFGPAGNNVVDTDMSGGGDMVGQDERMTPGGAAPMDIQHPAFGSRHGSKENMMDVEHQARLAAHHRQQQAQQQHQQFYGQYPRHGVPPTPNSLEMQGAHPQFQVMNPGQARAFYETYARKQQEQMVFTPLVSPAVTPLDTQFARMPEFAVPGEYFSPLTSPALQAQHSGPTPRSGYGSIKGSDTSEAPSPVDMDVDSPRPASGPTLVQPKPKRKTTAKPRAVRQSPAMKPQRKKGGNSMNLGQRDIADIMEGFTDNSTSPAQPRSGSGRLPLPRSQESSETGSISPEPLSEILMPPPATPRPGTSGRSPNLHPQDANVNGSAPRSAPMKPMDNPATPASLMRLQKSNSTPTQSSSTNTRLNQAANVSGVGDIALPREKPDLLVDTQMVEDDMTTPTLTPRNGPKSAPMTVPPSPAGSAITSPRGGKTPVMGTGLAKGKKRGSSSQASPALRPRISPSIKPLLPEGAKITPETSTLLLMQKSNYQNILEGTHLPGVSYPDALSENLTSKRTSHKIAEQGRRNRINTALQEIAALLPDSMRSPSINAKDADGSPNGVTGKEGKEGTNGTSTGGKGSKGKERSGSASVNASTSKANTVEQAIEYIKALKGELEEAKAKLAYAERKLSVWGGGEEVGSVEAEGGEDPVDASEKAKAKDATTGVEKAV